MRHFCKFYKTHNISDLCLPDKSQDERNFFMAMYASCLALGHTLLAKSIKADTMMLYFKATALLCEPRMLVSPL
eukprot:843718-Ditylum_brightwellii.AAC.1